MMLLKLLPLTTSLALLTNAQTLLPASQCQTPPVQCCQYAGKPALDPHIRDIVNQWWILGIDPNTLVGLSCTSIPNVGPGSGATCATNALCCVNTNGLIAYDCQYVNLSQ